MGVVVVVVVYFVIKRSDKFLVKSVIFKTFNKWPSVESLQLVSYLSYSALRSYIIHMDIGLYTKSNRIPVNKQSAEMYQYNSHSSGLHCSSSKDNCMKKQELSGT